MRIVLDTNLLVSALLNRSGSPAQLLDQWNDDHYDLVTSAEQLSELRRVLSYPRVAKYFEPGAAERLLDRIVQAAIIVGDLPTIDAASDDDDNLILATAVAGQVDLLVSGDLKHVLPLGEVQGIPIVTVLRALEVLRSRGNGGADAAGQ